jgi:hypothetical protein
MSESQTIVKELLQAKEEANNLLHNTVIKIIQCNFPYTLDDVMLSLYEKGVWVEYKCMGSGRFILRLEWNNE